jgi:hypothetical protein
MWRGEEGRGWRRAEAGMVTGSVERRVREEMGMENVERRGG